MLRFACLAAAVAVVATGCAGGHSSAPAQQKAAPSSRAQSQSHEPASAPRKLSKADGIAYYQIATTSGLLRARAVTLLSGSRGTPDTTLLEGRRRLDRLAPDSGILRRLRDALAHAIDNFEADKSRAAARAAMKDTVGIGMDLATFSRGKAVHLLLPD